MKKIVFLLLSSLISAANFAQNLPIVPRKTEFAGLTVHLDADAQKAVQDEVKFLLLPDNKMLQDKLERMQLYFPIIESILEEAAVPDDFKYLAVVESSLIPEAISPSNAIGFWQMKAETAQELGLKISDQVDERKNIYASTHAAALYLKRNNLIYKNWLSTLYSYYQGASGISKMIPSNWNSASEVNLDAKTNRYIIKTIAHRIAFENRLNRLRELPFSLVEYKNSGGKTVEQIASDLKVDVASLQKYNSWLNTNSIPADKDYSLAVYSPIENIDQIQHKIKKEVPSFSTKSTTGFPITERLTGENPNGAVYYQINDKKGILAQENDDVTSLAQKGNIKVSRFLFVNDMNENEAIKVGNIYYLEKKDRKAKIPFHTTTSKQTLWDVSQMYGVKLYRLQKFNRINPVDALQEGRVVWLQKKIPSNQPVEYKQVTPTKDDSPTLNQGNKEDQNTIEVSHTTPHSEPINTNITTREDENKGSIVLEEDKKQTPVNTKYKKKEKILEPEVAKTTEEPEIIVLKEDENTLAPTKTKTTTAKSSPATTTPVLMPKSFEKSMAKSTTNTHFVKPGETLYSIARLYNVSSKTLGTWNNLPNDVKLNVGQPLIVSQPNQKASQVIEKTSPPPAIVEKAKTTETSHIVAAGETLYSIAKKYGLSIKDVQDLNGMKDNGVKLGQRLVIKK